MVFNGKEGIRIHWYFLFSSTKCVPRLHATNRSFSSDVTAAILVYQNNEMAAILVYGTGISSFSFKYFVLFHHPTGATDHVSENDLYAFQIMYFLFVSCINAYKCHTTNFLLITSLARYLQRYIEPPSFCTNLALWAQSVQKRHRSDISLYRPHVRLIRSY